MNYDQWGSCSLLWKCVRTNLQAWYQRSSGPGGNQLPFCAGTSHAKAGRQKAAPLPPSAFCKQAAEERPVSCPYHVPGRSPSLWPPIPQLASSDSPSHLLLCSQSGLWLLVGAGRGGRSCHRMKRSLEGACFGRRTEQREPGAGCLTCPHSCTKMLGNQAPRSHLGLLA